MTCLAFAIAVGGDINKGVQCGLSLGSILFDFFKLIFCSVVATLQRSAGCGGYTWRMLTALEYLKIFSEV